jgi:hypothetical protein
MRGRDDALEIQRKALRDELADPRRSARHEAAIQIYLAGIAYADSRPRRSAEADDVARPVDEPAPLVDRR